MKKVLSIIIAMAVLLSCLTITAFAQEQAGKITSALAAQLATLPEGDKLETCIWLYYQHDADFIERKTFEECGLTAGTCMTLEEVDVYSKTYNRIAAELEAAGNQAFIEKTGVSEEDIVFCSAVSPLVILNVTKEQIYAVAEFKEVQSLDYDTTVLADEPSETDVPYEHLDPAPDTQNGKISAILAEKMAAAGENDSLNVIIWVKPVSMSSDQIHRQALTDAGFSIFDFGKLNSHEMSRYISARRAIESDLERQARERFIEQSGMDEDKINAAYCLFINASLTKAEIESAAACSRVDIIYYDDSNELVIEAPTEPAEPPYLYRARFVQQVVDKYSADFYYRELYYHTDKNGETDWALVYAYLPICAPMEHTAIVGNRVVHSGSIYTPFDTCYGIYDVKEDKFIDAGSSAAKSYDGFVKAFDEIGGGRLIGDIDRNDELSIIDVTLLQRCEAHMRDYPEDDTFVVTYEWDKTRYFSDFNRDGERDILDVTVLQRYLISET